MKPTALLLVILSACAVPGGAAEPSPEKIPFHRPWMELPRTKPLVVDGPVVVNAASYLPGISPGSLATVFGRDLTSVSDVVVAGTNPLPTELAGVSVVVNGRYAPVFSIAYANGQDQISFQVPYETPTGPRAAQIIVLDRGAEVGRVEVDSYTEDPGIFSYGDSYAVALLGTDYSLVGPGNEALPGDVLVLFTTGLGPVTANVRDGVGAPSNPLAYTKEPLDVYLAGQRCEVLFAGLAPGFAGLYQVNFVVPRDAPRGLLDLQIQTPYQSSGVVRLPVR